MTIFIYIVQSAMCIQYCVALFLLNYFLIFVVKPARLSLNCTRVASLKICSRVFFVTPEIKVF